MTSFFLQLTRPPRGLDFKGCVNGRMRVQLTDPCNEADPRCSGSQLRTLFSTGSLSPQTDPISSDMVDPWDGHFQP